MGTPGPRSGSQHSGTGRPAGATRRDRQIVRILATLRILSQGRTPTVHDLAAEFHTRRETIYRDLRVLQEAGYPLAGDEQGRLSRPRLLASRLPEIRFSRAELEALLLAVAQVQTAFPNAQTLCSATLKLKALAEPERALGDPRSDEIFETWSCGSKDYSAHDNLIALLIEAILRRRSCMVEYRKPLSTEPKTYAFDPFRVLLVGGGLYVVGRGPKRTGTITLAVHRLLSVNLLQAEFEIAPDFDVRKCRDDAFGISWQDPKDIVLKFQPDQAPYVRERLWHPTQQITELSDGSLELSFRAGGPFEIRRWILGWGDAVEVLSPEDLRQEVRHLLTSAAFRYEPESAKVADARHQTGKELSRP